MSLLLPGEKATKKRVVILKKVVKRKNPPKDEPVTPTPVEVTPSRTDAHHSFVTPEANRKYQRQGSTLSRASTVDLDPKDIDEQLQRCSTGDLASAAYMIAQDGSPETKDRTPCGPFILGGQWYID